MTERGSIERPNAVYEVEFALPDSAYPFVELTETADCTLELAEMVPRSGGRYAEFFNVTGAGPERVAEVTAGTDEVDATLLAEYDHSRLFEFVVSGGCPARRLAELGALPRTVRGDDGTGRIVAEIPESYDAADVVGTFLEEHPDAELVSKREKDAVQPLVSRSSVRQVLQSSLTDRQREVLETAFETGYYDWPREATGEDVADELGITSATFAEHIRAAEHHLLAVFVRGRGLDF